MEYLFAGLRVSYDYLVGKSNDLLTYFNEDADVKSTKVKRIYTKLPKLTQLSWFFGYPTYIKDKIYLGSAFNAATKSTLETLNIKYVINVTDKIENYLMTTPIGSSLIYVENNVPAQTINPTNNISTEDEVRNHFADDPGKYFISGLTDSKFVPTLDGDTYKTLKDFIEEKTGEQLIDPTDSSKKLKATTKSISIIKKSLKDHPVELKKFEESMEKAKDLTEQKRYYISNYGFKNFVDVVTGKTDVLIKDEENYDKFYLENVVNWWKKKAQSRFESLQSENRLRDELEVWTSGKEIQIIR